MLANMLTRSAFFCLSFLALHLPLFALVSITNNPYAGVDWSQPHFKANFHTHTTVSDGSFHPHTVIDQYHAAGYSILAVTDHNRTTYPWSAFSDFSVSGTTMNRISEGRLTFPSLDFENRDPAALGMVAIPGNELSALHHKVSLFSELEIRGPTEWAELEAVREANGLVFFAHPERYGRTPEWYIPFYEAFPDQLIGLELSDKTRPAPRDVLLWDLLLSHFMPQQPIWGILTDDMHSTNHFGMNWTTFILAESDLTVDGIRRAMEQGAFYSPSRAFGNDPPVLKSFRHDENGGTLEVEAEGAAIIRWVSEFGREVGQGAIFTYRDYADVNRYLRVELIGPDGGVTFLQPLAVSRQRVWTMADGESFNGRYGSEGAFSAQVTLGMDDGSERVIPVRELSVADQTYLAAWRGTVASRASAGRAAFEAFEDARRERNAARAAAATPRPMPVNLSPELLATFTGTYAMQPNPYLPAGTLLILSAVEGQLVLATEDRSFVSVLPARTENSFSLEALGAVVTFEMGEEGRLARRMVVTSPEGALGALRVGN
jgi:hypothetical protein